jgi:hypothetical protein
VLVDVSDEKLALLKSLFEVRTLVKEIETLVSQFGAKGGLLTFDDFVKVFQEVL